MKRSHKGQMVVAQAREIPHKFPMVIRSYEMPLGDARAVPPKAVKGTVLHVLGCGASSGVPLLACPCSVCKSRNPKNKRLRASVYFQVGKKVFLVDTSPDFRQQAHRAHLHWIDAVLFTHPHADHIHGLDDLRAFNFLMAKSIDCYGNSWTIETLASRFDYIFKKTQVGGGKPQLNLHIIDKPQTIHGVRVIPLELIHGRMPVLGYRIKNVAYITDLTYLPDSTLRLLKGLDVLVLDCLRPEPHSTHLHVDSAVQLATRIGAKRTFFTHMGHELEYKQFSRYLPKNMFPAFDGLIIKA